MNTRSLNAMFNDKSNAMCNNAPFTSPRIVYMHIQMKRLYSAALELKGIATQADLAKERHPDWTITHEHGEAIRIMGSIVEISIDTDD